MIRHWTRFKGEPYKRFISDDMRVTLGPRGVMYINVKAWDALGRPDAVELLFDAALRTIGVRPARSWQPSTFKVKDKSGTRGKCILAAAFLAHFRIRSTRTIIFNAVQIDHDGVMLLPLDAITAVSRGAR